MIPLSNINLGKQESHYVTQALAQGQISGTGTFVGQFEAALAQKHAIAHALAVTNGTHALELLLRALDIRPGDEVIVPALTFVSPAAAVRSLGAIPVFADITEESWTIDWNRVHPLVNRRTRAIIGVDLLGHPCDFTNHVYQGVDIIEDAAQAHGARLRGGATGTFGTASTFSFHANKTITTGEGGAVLTRDSKLAQRLRLIANHGMTPQRRYWHDVVGSNYRMTNLTAAIGLGQVEYWDERVAARQHVALRYDELLGDLLTQGDLSRRPVAPWATEACCLFGLAHPNRDRILSTLRAHDIDARPIWTALCDLPLYRDSVRGDYPIARRISQEAFLLPTWGGMPDALIVQVAEVVREAVKGIRHVHQHRPVDRPGAVRPVRSG